MGLEITGIVRGSHGHDFLHRHARRYRSLREVGRNSSRSEPDLLLPAESHSMTCLSPLGSLAPAAASCALLSAGELTNDPIQM